MIKEIKNFSKEDIAPIFPELSVWVNGYGEFIMRTTILVNKEDNIYTVLSQKIEADKIEYTKLSQFVDSLIPNINKLRKNYDYERCNKDHLKWYKIIE